MSFNNILGTQCKNMEGRIQKIRYDEGVKE
jgi:hypothetical protein